MGMTPLAGRSELPGSESIHSVCGARDMPYSGGVNLPNHQIFWNRGKQSSQKSSSECVSSAPLFLRGHLPKKPGASWRFFKFFTTYRW